MTSFLNEIRTQKQMSEISNNVTLYYYFTIIRDQSYLFYFNNINYGFM